MDNKGIGVVVHNGSSLFSGNAGSGESNIRKWMFEEDIVQAIIQLPTEEFFNTNIFTYLWILNKNKKPEQKNRVMMIDASSKYQPLKKTKGQKRKEIDAVSCKEILQTFVNFKENEYAKIYDREFFYYNKQAIQLTNLDSTGKTIESLLEVKKKSIKLTPITIEQGKLNLSKFKITAFDKDKYPDLKSYNKFYVREMLKDLDYKELNLKVHTKDAIYFYDNEKDTIIKQTGGKQEVLGCGKIVIKSLYKKPTKTKDESINITVELFPSYEKDNEFIPFNKDEKLNDREIEKFMNRHISRPFIYLENTIGVEINFNKIFYKPKKLRELTYILKDIEDVNNQLTKLESEFAL